MTNSRTSACSMLKRSILLRLDLESYSIEPFSTFNLASRLKWSILLRLDPESYSIEPFYTPALLGVEEDTQGELGADLHFASFSVSYRTRCLTTDLLATM